MKAPTTKTQRWKKTAKAPATKRIGEQQIDGYQAPPRHRMTEEQFVEWAGEKTRAEWVDGEVIIISPVNTQHERIQGWLYRLLSEYADEMSSGRVSGPELPVRLPNGKSRRLTDNFFVLKGREKAFTKSYFDGAPDLIIEVVSPDSTARDYREKYASYESAGVREYWIIDPLAISVTAYELASGKYRVIEEKHGIIRSKILKRFFLKPAWIWHEPFPRLSTALREMGIN